MAMRLLVFTYIVLVILCTSYRIEGRIGFMSKDNDNELEAYLNALNKPPIKSFKSKDGAIIDCIAINKQPALDHPLLKNHTIQLRPTSLPKGVLTLKSGSSSKLAKYRGVNCPPRTVPIRRTTKEDLIRAKSMSRLHLPPAHSFVSNGQGHYFATSGTILSSPQSYGATASINIYNETVSPNQYSGAGIWIGNSINGRADGIHYGWTVNPTLYGDQSTRTVSFWTANNGQHGCFNILCPGFVQVSSQHPLGDKITRESLYGGEQYVMMALIYKDIKTGNWWVVENMDDDGQVQIGYWPASLFTSLATSATEVRFGGEVYSPPNESLPSMGSGHFEPPDFTKTSYIAHIQFVDAQNRPYDADKIGISSFSNLPKCYDVKYLGDSGEPEEYALLFGGGGGSSCT